MTYFLKTIRNIPLIFPLLFIFSLHGCGSSGGGNTGGGNPSVTLDRIEVTPTKSSIPKGKTIQFRATGVFSDQSKQDFTNNVIWKSDNSIIAKFSTSARSIGLATALSKGGPVKITANLGNITGETSLTVTDPVLDTIILNPPNNLLISNSGIITGTTAQFTATGIYSDGSAQDLTSLAGWSSKDSAVATVSSKGLVTGVKAGLTDISASMGGISGNPFSLTIIGATLQSISITPVNQTIHKGNSLQFKAMGNFDQGLSQNISNQVTWDSTSPSIASIDLTDPTIINVKGEAVGQSTITATLGAFSDQTPVTIDPAVLVSIQITASNKVDPLIDPLNPSIANGSTVNFEVIGLYTDGTTSDLTSASTLSSSDTSVATIDHAGLATSLKPGSTTITAVFGTIPASLITLTVTAATLVSIEVTPGNLSLAKGLTQQFKATGTYTDGSQQDLTAQVTWSSTSGTSTTAATVNNSAGRKGLATTVAPGAATIQAKDSGSSLFGNTTLTVTTDILASIIVAPANPSIVSKGTQLFSATGTFSGTNSTPPIGPAIMDITPMATWSSSDTSVAVISNAPGSSGLATARSVSTAQQAIIKATLSSYSGINGTTALTVQPLNSPDLQINVLTGSMSTTSLYVSDIEMNDGNQPAGNPFNVSFYLSLNPLSSFSTSSSTLVGFRTLSDLPAGGINSATTTFAIPSSMATGKYYLCGVTDSGNTVTEFNNVNNDFENNNSLCTASPSFNIGQDLRVNSISGSLSGSNMIVSDTEMNYGNQSAPLFTVSFYLSTTSGPNPTAPIQLGTRTISGLAAGGANSTSSTFPIPQTAPVGDYYLCAIADSGSTISESNENNNSKCTTGTFSIGADLRVAGLNVSLSGSTIFVSDSEINSGNQTAVGFSVSYYLSSTSGDVSSPAILLGSRTISSLAGGNGTNTSIGSFLLPAGISSGNYFVVVFTDSGSTVAETSEVNNIKSSSSLTIFIP